MMLLSLACPWTMWFNCHVSACQTLERCAMGPQHASRHLYGPETPNPEAERLHCSVIKLPSSLTCAHQPG